jgi:hypothetical protein
MVSTVARCSVPRPNRSLTHQQAKRGRDSLNWSEHDATASRGSSSRLGLTERSCLDSRLAVDWRWRFPFAFDGCGQLLGQ